nr:hypothetical protein HK105_001742 [Polyrhizophydium stewartii]
MALVARLVAKEVAKVQATGKAGACRATVRAAKRQADPDLLKVAALEQHASPPPSTLAPPAEVPGLTTEAANQEALELADRRVQEMILSPEAQGLDLTTMVRTPTATPAQIKAVAEVINSLSEGERPAPGLTQVDLGARYCAITKCAIALRSLDSTPVEGAPPHLIVGRLVQKWGPSESNALLAAIGTRPTCGCYPAALLMPGLLARALLELQNGEIGFYARKCISTAKLTSRTAPEFRMLVEELRELNVMAQDLPGFEKLAVQQLASELSRGATLIEQDRIKQAREAPNLEAAISLLTARSFNGQYLKLEWKCEIKICVSNYTRRILAFVSNMHSAQIILGKPWIGEHHVVINLQDRSFTVRAVSSDVIHEWFPYSVAATRSARKSFEKMCKVLQFAAIEMTHTEGIKLVSAEAFHRDLLSYEEAGVMTLDNTQHAALPSNSAAASMAAEVLQVVINGGDVEKLLDKYQHLVFNPKMLDQPLPSDVILPMRILLVEGAKILWLQLPSRLSLEKHQLITEQITKLREQGFIRPSASQYATLVFVMAKQQGLG